MRYTYALHMALISDHADQDEVVVFMKDTHRRHHHKRLKSRPLVDVAEEANGPVGFSCGCLPLASGTLFHPTDGRELFRRDLSFWHLTREVEKFETDTYVANGAYGMNDLVSFEKNTSLSKWWHEMDIQMPKPLMPICYSGSTAKFANILPKRSFVKNLSFFGAWR